MYLQEFKIYLIGGHVLKAAEEVTIPAEHRLLNRFKKAKPDDILSVGSEETSQACSRFFPMLGSTRCVLCSFSEAKRCGAN